MATIGSVSLSILHDHIKKTAQVTVKTQVRFTPYELIQMKEGLRFKCKCELWGEDVLNPDVFLYALTPKYYPDSSPSATEDVVFSVTLGEGVLDEDLGTDEVYAKIRLVNLYTQVEVSRNSNTFSHDF